MEWLAVVLAALGTVGLGLTAEDQGGGGIDASRALITLGFCLLCMGEARAGASRCAFFCLPPPFPRAASPLSLPGSAPCLTDPWRCRRLVNA